MPEDQNPLSHRSITCQPTSFSPSLQHPPEPNSVTLKMEAACSFTLMKETYGVIPQMKPAMKALKPMRKKHTAMMSKRTIIQN